MVDQRLRGYSDLDKKDFVIIIKEYENIELSLIGNGYEKYIIKE